MPLNEASPTIFSRPDKDMSRPINRLLFNEASLVNTNVLADTVPRVVAPLTVIARPMFKLPFNEASPTIFRRPVKEMSRPINRLPFNDASLVNNNVLADTFARVAAPLTVIARPRFKLPLNEASPTIFSRPDKEMSRPIKRLLFIDTSRVKDTLPVKALSPPNVTPPAATLVT